MENWKDVVGYEGHFMVSESGKIKSLDRTYVRRDGKKYPITGKELTPFIGNTGYTRIALRRNAMQVKYSIHRLVAEAFLPKEKGRDFVNHLDGNRLNNHYSNLEWVNNRENSCHKYKNQNTSSKYIGVSYINAKKKFVASICVGNIDINLGAYLTEEEAYAARCNYEKEKGIINKYL